MTKLTMKAMQAGKVVRESMEDTMSRRSTKKFTMLALLLVCVMVVSVPVSAEAQNIDIGTTGSDVLGTIGNIVKRAGLIIGGILVMVGLFQFGMAFRNEDAEGKTKASHTLVAGIIIAAVGGAAAALGLALGGSGSST